MATCDQARLRTLLGGGHPSSPAAPAHAVLAHPVRTGACWLAACLLVSAAIRIVSTATVPLIISNDSIGYIAWAEQLMSGRLVDILPHRTPGYPLFLAGVFHVLGVSGPAILVSHHLLAWLATPLVFWIARIWARPSIAMCAAILYSLDPWLLGLETFALTETLTWFVILAAIGLVWFRPQGSLLWVLLLGALLGFAALTRPTCQALIPFLLLARVARTWRSWPRAAAMLLVGFVGVALVLVPWLRFNQKRGIEGLASGAGAQVWIDLAILGILNEPDFELPEDVQRIYREAGMDRPGWSEDQLFQFLYGIDAFHTRSELLGKWARHSIRANPAAYFKAAACAVCWQLKLFPAGGHKLYDDVQFFMARAAIGGDNRQFGGEPPGVGRFLAYSEGGWFRKYLRACEKLTLPGVPAVPLFVAAGLGLLLRLAVRDWPAVFVIAATISFVLAHALLLSPMSRYTLPLWPAWYATGVIVIEWLWRRLDLLRG